MSLIGIGRVFGGRHNATVLYAIRQAEKRIATDPAYAQRVRCIEESLSSAEWDMAS